MDAILYVFVKVTGHVTATRIIWKHNSADYLE